MQGGIPGAEVASVLDEEQVLTRQIPGPRANNMAVLGSAGWQRRLPHQASSVAWSEAQPHAGAGDPHHPLGNHLFCLNI